VPIARTSEAMLRHAIVAVDGADVDSVVVGTNY
jgi:hypothetical protein